MAELQNTFNVIIPTDIPLPPAEGANWFHFTSAGLEVQMLIGTIDLLAAHQARQPGADADTKLAPAISHRFLLSPIGFAVLKAQVDEIAASVGPANLTISARKAK